MTYEKKQDESFDKFMTKLKKLSSDCELGELKNYLIKNIVAICVTDNSLRKRVLKEPNINLEKVIALRQFLFFFFFLIGIHSMQG